MTDRLLAPYACDRCQSRKIACTRERPGCQRCKGLECTYSRSGVIHRNRKRKHGAALPNGPPAPSQDGSASHSTPASTVNSGHIFAANDTGVQSHLAADIEATRERLGSDGLGSSGQSLGALSSLAEACAAVWHDTADFNGSSKSFFLFKEQAAAWVDIFATTLERGRPLLSPAPPEVLELLRACRPDQVQERAWLVMYYGTVLSNITSKDPTNEAVKAKLRCNLWIVLNDARLLLEASEANIQALTILACHVEEFTTPSLCWMLTTTACRMLQALGVNHRRLDSQTRERRRLIFFHLNILDKGMSLVFGRPPTFHRAMSREVPPPTLEQLRPMQPHVTASGTHSLFAAHFFHQLMFFTRVLGDVWHCLHEDPAPSEECIHPRIEDLESWYREARQVLDAAALVERPFMEANSSRSIDLGLRMLEFQYHYVLILLCRASPILRERAVNSSIKMLSLLEHLVSDSEEPFNGIVWQLICCPFTAFLALFTDILSDKFDDMEQRATAISAMEKLPAYLNRMSLRSALAKKLESVAAALLNHANTTNTAHQEETLPTDWDFWDGTFNGILAMSTPPGDFTGAAELPDWTLDVSGDPTLDWIAWDSLS